MSCYERAYRGRIGNFAARGRGIHTRCRYHCCGAKVEHYEIASYGSVRTFAHLLGQNKAAELLQTTLDEESETNELLNRLATSTINPEALMETELAGAGSSQ